MNYQFKNILALDPATKTGWAHSCGQSGVWDLSAQRDESKDMRLIHLKAKLNKIIAAVPIDLIAFEAVRNAAPNMQRSLIVQSELQSVIKVFCEERSIFYSGYSPSEIKKFATGKGNASKEKMIAAAREKFPNVDIIDDNHADALHLLHMSIFAFSQWG